MVPEKYGYHAIFQMKLEINGLIYTSGGITTARIMNVGKLIYCTGWKSLPQLRHNIGFESNMT